MLLTNLLKQIINTNFSQIFREEFLINNIIFPDTAPSRKSKYFHYTRICLMITSALRLLAARVVVHSIFGLRPSALGMGESYF